VSDLLSEWQPEDDLSEILITEEHIRQRIAELGVEITRDYADHPPLLLGVLKGASTFLVDLAREIHLPIEIDFMAVSSYWASTQSSGVVRILKDLDQPIEGKHVLIIEDIVDSGLTLAYILNSLETRLPASVRICGLLVKDRPRDPDVPVHYVGFPIPDRFVVGYGLDFAERYRNLRYVGVLKPDLYADSEETAFRQGAD
jgi:hypoxanthine phosphoribosyltransferase